MNRSIRTPFPGISRVVIVMLLLSFGQAVPASAMATRGAPASALSVAKLDLPPTFGKMPLYFVENRGHFDDQVAYYIQGTDTTLYFTATGVTFALADNRQKAAASPDEPAAKMPASPGTTQRWTVKLDFLGTLGVRPVAHDQAEGVVSYFIGTPDQWKTGLHMYSTLVYADLWPGIDLVYSGTADRLKYQFRVRPGADPNQIRLAYRGVTEVTLNAAGQLAISTPAGGFVDDAPVAYEETAGGQQAPVSLAYALGGGCAAPARRPAARYSGACAYSFHVGVYDRSQTLVLDPAVVIYAGYLGGSFVDYGRDIAVDPAGSAYVTGYTRSTDFPALVGPSGTNFGGEDAFVAKIKPDGSGLVYAGYIGGSSQDNGYGIALDSSGQAYITGFTYSTNFPVVNTQEGTALNGGNNTTSADAFVAVVSADGSHLIYSRYLGGAATDVGNRIAVATTPCFILNCAQVTDVYLTGYTASLDFPLVATTGLTAHYNNASNDAFIAEISMQSHALIWSGCLGGDKDDQGQGIAVGWSSGLDGFYEDVYVVGFTSSNTTFPVGGTGDLTFNGGTYDGFLAHFIDGQLDRVGYLGGSGDDYASTVAINDTLLGCYAWPIHYCSTSFNTFITGATASADFPSTPGLYTCQGSATNPDVFVAAVNYSGVGIYSGCIGGTGDDEAFDIAVDEGGYAYITGRTNSPNFPQIVGPGPYGGVYDAFVVKVKPDGTGLAYSGYLGGIGNDTGWGIALDGLGNAYVAGTTGSPAASFPVFNGPYTTYAGGGWDAFVAKIPDGALPRASFSNSSYRVNEGAGQASVTVNLNATSYQAVTVNYTTSDFTAQAGKNYAATSGALTFSPGVISQTINVGLIDDLLPGVDTVLTLTLSSPANAGLGTYSAVPLTIIEKSSFSIYTPLLVAPCTSPAAEVEPNNDLNNATSGIRLSGCSYSGKYSSAYTSTSPSTYGYDIDYFVIPASGAGQVTAQLLNASGTAPWVNGNNGTAQLQLRDAGNQFLGYAYGGDYTVSYNAPAAGTYYARVLFNFDGGKYQLRITMP